MSPDAEWAPIGSCERAIDLAWMHLKPLTQIAADLEISESCLPSRMDVADVEDGHKPEVNSDEKPNVLG